MPGNYGLAAACAMMSGLVATKTTGGPGQKSGTSGFGMGGGGGGGGIGAPSWQSSSKDAAAAKMNSWNKAHSDTIFQQKLWQ